VSEKIIDSLGVTKDKKCIRRYLFLSVAPPEIWGSSKYDVSHFCHDKRCFTPHNLCLESHSTNLKRSGCWGGSVCIHDPPCIQMTKERLNGLQHQLKVSEIAHLPNICMKMHENGMVSQIEQPIIPKAVQTAFKWRMRKMDENPTTSSSFSSSSSTSFIELLEYEEEDEKVPTFAPTISAKRKKKSKKRGNRALTSEESGKKLKEIHREKKRRKRRVEQLEEED